MPQENATFLDLADEDGNTSSCTGQFSPPKFDEIPNLVTLSSRTDIPTAGHLSIFGDTCTVTPFSLDGNVCMATPEGSNHEGATTSRKSFFTTHEVDRPVETACVAAAIHSCATQRSAASSSSRDRLCVHNAALVLTFGDESSGGQAVDAMCSTTEQAKSLYVLPSPHELTTETTLGCRRDEFKYQSDSGPSVSSKQQFSERFSVQSPAADMTGLDRKIAADTQRLSPAPFFPLLPDYSLCKTVLARPGGVRGEPIPNAGRGIGEVGLFSLTGGAIGNGTGHGGHEHTVTAVIKQPSHCRVDQVVIGGGHMDLGLKMSTLFNTTDDIVPRDVIGANVPRGHPRRIRYVAGSLPRVGNGQQQGSSSEGLNPPSNSVAGLKTSREANGKVRDASRSWFRSESGEQPTVNTMNCSEVQRLQRSVEGTEGLGSSLSVASKSGEATPLPVVLPAPGVVLATESFLVNDTTATRQPHQVSGRDRSGADVLMLKAMVEDLVDYTVSHSEVSVLSPACAGLSDDESPVDDESGTAACPGVLNTEHKVTATADSLNSIAAPSTTTRGAPDGTYAIITRTKGRKERKTSVARWVAGRLGRGGGARGVWMGSAVFRSTRDTAMLICGGWNGLPKGSRVGSGVGVEHSGVACREAGSARLSVIGHRMVVPSSVLPTSAVVSPTAVVAAIAQDTVTAVPPSAVRFNMDHQDEQASLASSLAACHTRRTTCVFQSGAAPLLAAGAFFIATRNTFAPTNATNTENNLIRKSGAGAGAGAAGAVVVAAVASAATAYMRSWIGHIGVVAADKARFSSSRLPWGMVGSAAVDAAVSNAEGADESDRDLWERYRAVGAGNSSVIPFEVDVVWPESGNNGGRRGWQGAHVLPR